MAEYQLSHDPNTVLRRKDNAHIPDDPANVDYQEYTAWLADGGVPDPYVPPPEPPPPAPDANMRLDAGVEAAVSYFNDTPIPAGLDATNSLEARVDRLEATVKAMLEGQMSHLEPDPL